MKQSSPYNEIKNGASPLWSTTFDRLGFRNRSTLTRRYSIYIAALFLGLPRAHGQTASPARSHHHGEKKDSAVKLDTYHVTDDDNNFENLMLSDTGRKRVVTSAQVMATPKGPNAGLNSLLFRLPGFSKGSKGQAELRGGDDLQYRINGVLLVPAGTSGFGQTFNTHFIESVDVVTGTLPAEYGFDTDGVVDIETKTVTNGDAVSVTGGSFNTLESSGETSGTQGKLGYYANFNYLTNGIGIDNPTSSRTAIHDRTDEFNSFAYLSYRVDDDSRLVLILNGATTKLQVPNVPGDAPSFTLDGVNNFNSAALNETASEVTGYGIVAYERTTDNTGLKISASTRSNADKFNPDPIGNLMFDGIADHTKETLLSNGLDADGVWEYGDDYVFRGGFTVEATRIKTQNTATVFPADSDGNQDSSTPFNIAGAWSKSGYRWGSYVQTDWDRWEAVNICAGVRLDGSSGFVKQSQLSPRLNGEYEFDLPNNRTLLLHAGYARYFKVPSLEGVPNSYIAKFADTTAEPETTGNSPVHAERSHYFDVGTTYNFSEALSFDVDTYYIATANDLDEGQFGNTNIVVPYNYRKGKSYGVDFSVDYTKSDFSTYANFSVNETKVREITSGQFQFSDALLQAYAARYVSPNDEQRYSGSLGASYKVSHSLVYGDMLYSGGTVSSPTGFRQANARNTDLSGYTIFNLGFEQTLPFYKHDELTLRLDITNIFDKVYKLHAGTSATGFGDASDYGQRRGFFGTATCSF